MRKLILTSLLLLGVSPIQAALLEQFEYNGHTYQIFSDLKNFSQATTDAQGRTIGGATGYLWNVNSAAENTFVYNKLTTYLNQLTGVANDGGVVKYVWLGASDSAVEGTWRWSDGNTNFWTGQGAAGAGGGSAVGGLYNNWGGTSTGTIWEPDNYMGLQNSAAIAMAGWGGHPNGIAGEWNDIMDTNSLPYVVEYNAVPEPSTYGLLGAAGILSVGLRRKRKKA